MRTFKLIDVHEKFHADAVDRFTVWDLSRKDRRENRGFRLDYILADSDIKLTLGAPLPLNSNDAEAAECCAATTDADFEFLCSSPARSGIIYTPEVYSDHLPVTALVNKEAVETLSTDWTVACAVRLKDAEQPGNVLKRRAKARQ
jgi:hypothetical protein